MPRHTLILDQDTYWSSTQAMLETFLLRISCCIYVSHSPFNAWNASLVVCLHDCATACAQYATKLTIAQCRIFLEVTVKVTLLALTALSRGKIME